MRFIAVFKQYKLLFFISFLAILILALMATIIYLNSRGNFINTSGKTVINYVGYDTLQQQINSAALDPSINQSPHFAKFNNYLQSAQNGTISEKNRYASLTNAAQELMVLYVYSSDPKARSLLTALGVFAKANFPKYYKANIFTYYCQDPSCSDDYPSPEFLGILTEIKNSDFPAPVKNDTAQYLLSVSYTQKQDVSFKVRMYLLTAATIRGYSQFTQTGANVKIADDLTNYVKEQYPKEFQSVSQNSAAANSRLNTQNNLPNQ